MSKEITFIQKYLNDVDAKLRERSKSEEEANGIIADISIVARDLEKEVGQFLQSNNFGAMTEHGADEVMVATEGLTAPAVTHDVVDTWLEPMRGFSTEHKAAAAKMVGIILSKYAKFKNNAYNAQTVKVNQSDITGDLVSLESLYPEFITEEFKIGPTNEASVESFGVDIDKAIPDLKASITVTLLRFHNSIVERLMPTMPAPQPYAQYVKEREVIIDLTTGEEHQILDLYDDPSVIDNELKIVWPLYDRAPDKLVEDGIIKPKVELDIVEASINPDKEGYAKVNYTDTLADNVKVVKTYVQLTDGTNTEIFPVEIPGELGRLSKTPNSMNDGNSGDRIGDIRHAIYLTKGAMTKKGTVSKILSICGDKEGIRVESIAKPKVNVINRKVDAFLDFTISAHHQVNDKDISEKLKKLVEDINGAGPVAIGYTLDARHREDNFRKSNKLVKFNRQPLAYEIPTAPNLFYDQAISQQSPETNSNNLTKVIAIGKDFRAISIAKETLIYINNMQKMNANNPLNKYDIGVNYVAGSKVRPFAWVGKFKANPDNEIKDADRSGDIKQRFISHLTYIVEKIHSESKYVQQLPAGSTVTYRLLTSNPVLGVVIGQPHFHTALDQQSSYGNSSGVEYKLVLPNGVVVECITTTFKQMKDQIMLLPAVKNGPSSDLNFAHNWNYGTVIGQYVQGSDGVRRRLFANSREIPIVTNPIGALITVTGLEKCGFVEEEK